jgi:3-oxoacyl-[acyl-carrier protein] reductase
MGIVAISDDVHVRAKELQSLGYTARPYKLDLTKFEDVKIMTEGLLREQGRIDILVNNAGMAPRARGFDLYGKLFVDLTEEEWDYQIAVNLKTTFNCIKTVLPTMIRQGYGRIVNISSVTGNIVSSPASTAYSAAKAAVSGLTKALALEVAEYGITVNAVCPGWIDTGRPLNKVAGLTTPMKRAGRPEEVADLILFLSSHESTYVTGQNVVIDGANSLQEYKGKGKP